MTEERSLSEAWASVRERLTEMWPVLAPVLKQTAFVMLLVGWSVVSHLNWWDVLILVLVMGSVEFRLCAQDNVQKELLEVVKLLADGGKDVTNAVSFNRAALLQIAPHLKDIVERAESSMKKETEEGSDEEA